MKKIFLCYLLFFGLCSVFQTQAIANNDKSDYPLIKGNYWIYQGNAKWQTAGNAIVEKQVTVKMQILEVMKRNHLTAAEVNGWPNDYRNDSTVGLTKHLIMRVGESSYFNLVGDRIETILNRIKDKKDNLGGMLSAEEEPDLELPLVVGKVFGNPDQVTRQDLYYCWVVIKEEEIGLAGIKGLESLKRQKQYTLRYSTLTSEVFMDFVPGVGFTGYKFTHHGSVDEADLKLVEANIGGN